MDANMLRRVTFAVTAIPVIGFLVWSGGAPLVCLIATAGLLGAREVYDLASRQGIKALQPTGLVAAALAPFAVYALISTGGMHQAIDGWWPYLPPGVLLILMLQALGTRGAGDRPLGAIAVTMFGVGYASLLPSFLLVIRMGLPRESWSGCMLVFFPLVVTWVCDTAAMFGGRMIGGPKLAPSISPGKTRAGAVAGLIGGTLVGGVFALWLFPRNDIAMPLLPTLLMAAVLSAVGQVGDLAESLFKREAGVKDSSALIPGHGGVLDRLDSLYFVLPVAAAGYHLLGLA